MTPFAVIAAGFVLTLAAMLAVEIAARRRTGPRPRPMGEALHAALLHPITRWLTLAGWLWLGFHFLAR
ncbi:DUF6186 family protein [Pseudonocardia bannensis]|uniref:Uncharacterized protein n=1 Tax=Pseudonocardia bannensis TaxID=630973 RepID=A0A848DP07_9PSEU|nr:DUF6186 family protein [Pseudonocardia bannensis]NMH94196.1 hypothetical protein [Pseudonocardia bannensis]